MFYVISICLWVQLWMSEQVGNVALKSGIKILILKLKTWGQVDICLETSTFYLTKKRKYVVSKKKKKKKKNTQLAQAQNCCHFSSLLLIYFIIYFFFLVFSQMHLQIFTQPTTLKNYTHSCKFYSEEDKQEQLIVYQLEKQEYILKDITEKKQQWVCSKLLQGRKWETPFLRHFL